MNERQVQQLYDSTWKGLKEQHYMAVSTFREYTDETAQATAQQSMLTTLNAMELLPFAQAGLNQLEQLREAVEDVAMELQCLNEKLTKREANEK